MFQFWPGNTPPFMQGSNATVSADCELYMPELDTPPLMQGSSTCLAAAACPRNIDAVINDIANVFFMSRLPIR